jgi:cytochrome c oxidase subunit II
MTDLAAPPAPDPASDIAAEHAERVEHRWAVVMVAIVVLLTAIATYAALYHAAVPQARVETVDPRTLHLSGEFIESNLGSALEPDGAVTVRGVGQQYSFTPSCLLVPADTQITFRMTSADVVHGFLIADTNVNLMLVPGYVSNLRARFAAPGERLMPCHEFCGVGHEGMWARVKIVDKAAFAALAAQHRRLSCVE